VCTDGVGRGLEIGAFPWWTSADLKISFFRPLSSIWRALDYWLWGESAVMPHLEMSIAYAALILVAAAVYRSWIGRGAAAGLAALLYAVNHGHGVAAVWIANRYSMLAALFGLMAILAHIRRPRGRTPAWLSPALLALGFAAAETTLGAFAYLLAFACFAD